ncbi:PHA/PHB synthase family protein [Curvivirga aplysinae]|uniref:PHA/PHB synthase family protein n=1 Tax=Curvivirga aplysinae TaxID=2529852 RepID=UPI001F30F553|nr:class I poly(R)-hydroxyalkanoic acid synthase [Curvivirga aplysinae]
MADKDETNMDYISEYLATLFPDLEEKFDPQIWADNWSKLQEHSHTTMKEIIESSQTNMDKTSSQYQEMADPFNLGTAFLSWTQNMIQNPETLIKTQTEYWQNMLSLWQQTAEQMMVSEDGNLGNPISVIEPDAGDRRFSDPSWNENAIFNLLKQSYLLTANWMHKTAETVEGVDDHDAQKIEFFTHQVTDAISPTNFWATNPTVLKETMETNGENLIRGFDNLVSDLDKETGKLKISMTDPEAFSVGENLATTEGKVIFENDLMQLLQYSPKTDSVFTKPLLIVPPWINKFYILDLGPKKSFIKYAVEQGHTVFIISWVNPDSSLRDKGFEDYMLQGPLAALDAIEKATGEKSVNTIGYCIGGTLLSATLAYMSTKDDKRISSATFFTTLTDFENAGELKVFIDEEQISNIEASMEENGYLDGSEMAMTFNMLRPNDLIWSFVINNYLMGKQPFPFDLLYWNSDSTRMPEKMHSYYLRNMYLENNLIKPNCLTLAGENIDLGKVKTPCFILSTKDDHIAPWQATYSIVNAFSGPVKFVLAGSGHIAGVINPPGEKEKYGYWSYDPRSKIEEPEDWFSKSKLTAGSWWPEWQKWISRKAGKKVDARIPGTGKLTAIEDAPGRYVKTRL